MRSLWGLPQPLAVATLPEYEKAGMVLAGVDLAYNATHSWTVVANDHEQVFRDVAHGVIHRHDFDMRRPLPIRAHLVLALDDEDASFAQNTMGFTSCLPI